MGNGDKPNPTDERQRKAPPRRTEDNPPVRRPPPAPRALEAADDFFGDDSAAPVELTDALPQPPPQRHAHAALPSPPQRAAQQASSLAASAGLGRSSGAILPSAPSQPRPSGQHAAISTPDPHAQLPSSPRSTPSNQAALPSRPSGAQASVPVGEAPRSGGFPAIPRGEMRSIPGIQASIPMDRRRQPSGNPESGGYEAIPIEPTPPETILRRPTNEQMPAVSLPKNDSPPEQFAAMARRLQLLQEEVLKLRKEVRTRPEAHSTDQQLPPPPIAQPTPHRPPTHPNGPPSLPADAPRPILPPHWGLAHGAPTQETDEAARRNQIDFFLRLMIDRGASDLHVHVGNSPIYRQGGQIAPMRFRPLRQRDWDRLIRPICPPGIWDAFQATGDIDFAYEIPEVARFRVNLLRQHHGAGAVFRIIPTKILTLEQLGMPPQLSRFAELNSGLVLITGPTGSGKSTTLAALIDMINRQKASHIITIEDPIEFVHTPRNSLIHQREVGAHAATFYEALQAAMREDPDLILVGELRDRETMNLALQAAEKGMLVYGTLHTNSAAKTVDRIINAFPTDEQDQIRAVLASTLRGVVAQQLLRRTTGGRVAALEILFCNRASANLIRENKTHHLNSFIQTGSRDGMVLMDQSLMALVQQGTITRDAALEKAIDKNLFLKA